MLASQNPELVQKAAYELMVESLFQADDDRRVSSLVQDELVDEAALAKAPRSHRTVADGYYDWAAYVMMLRNQMEAGVELPILADEAEGLQAIAAARGDFERDHLACPGCGARQYSKTAFACRACHRQLREKR